MLEIIDDFYKDPELQAEIRKDFADSQADTVAKIRAHLKNNELTAAEILAHNLKSVSAMLYEKKLAEAALAIELQLKKGEIPSENALSRLGILINRVLQKA